MTNYLNIEKNKTELLQKGYSVIENKLSTKTLKSAQVAFNEIYEIAMHEDYNYVRVYDDYSNNKNIAGIEMPFHRKILRQEIINLIEESEIIHIARNIMEDDVILELSRYHLTKEFSHLGIWHRDEDVHKPKYDSLQFNIFLFDEIGLQIVDESHKIKDENVDIMLKKNPYSTIKNSKWLKTYAGDILVFDPSVLHRGASAKPRANIHFRFRKKNKKNYTFQSLDYLNYYKISESLKQQMLYNLNNLNIIDSYKHPNSIKCRLKRMIRRFIHNFIIFLPLNSKVYRFFLVWPNLTLRKLFRIDI
jgi:ectoine hydroxylase-related dioxygenase (phytanoyl-CoA dioxygenase family)